MSCEQEKTIQKHAISKQCDTDNNNLLSTKYIQKTRKHNERKHKRIKRNKPNQLKKSGKETKLQPTIFNSTKIFRIQSVFQR